MSIQEGASAPEVEKTKDAVEIAEGLARVMTVFDGLLPEIRTGENEWTSAAWFVLETWDGGSIRVDVCQIYPKDTSTAAADADSKEALS